jgi:hypothetical protein
VVIAIHNHQPTHTDLIHTLARLIHSRLWRYRERRFDNDAFRAFDALHTSSLLLNGHKAMQDANAAQLCHGNRHLRFSDCIHIGRDDGDG